MRPQLNVSIWLRAEGYRVKAHLDWDLPLLTVFKAQSLEHTIHGSNCCGRHPRAAEYQGCP